MISLNIRGNVQTNSKGQNGRSVPCNYGSRSRPNIPRCSSVKRTVCPTHRETGKSRKADVVTVRRSPVTAKSVPASITVAEWFTQWLPIIEKQVRPNTFRGYKGNMTNHIIPYFEELNIPIEQVTYRHIQAYYDSKIGVLSATSIRHHAENMSKAFEDAIFRELLAFNPTKRAKPPKMKKFKAEFLNLKEIEQLLSLFKGNIIELPVTLCSIYGFRRSEVLGLKWENIDFVGRTIYIVETLQQHTGGDYTDDTKTESSTRTMPMTDTAYYLLMHKKREQEQMKKLMKKRYIDTDYVCTQRSGKPISPNYLSKHFHAVAKDVFKKVRLHDLRHSAATNLLEMGFSVAQVAEWLGHSSPEITLRFYAHATKESKVKIANALDTNLVQYS